MGRHCIFMKKKKKTMKKDKRKLLVWPWANNLIYFKRSQTWITLTSSFFCLFPGHWTLLREDRELFSLSTHKFLQSNFGRAFCIQQFCNHNQVCSSSWLVQNFPFFTLACPSTSVYVLSRTVLISVDFISHTYQLSPQHLFHVAGFLHFLWFQIRKYTA